MVKFCGEIVTVKDYGCPADKRFKAFIKGQPELSFSGRTAVEAGDKLRRFINGLH